MSIESAVERMKESGRKREEAIAKTKAEIEEWIAVQPASADCQSHPGQECKLAANWLRRELLTRTRESWRTEYLECPLCREERVRGELRRAGVPEVLLHCSLDNWKPRNKAERDHLEAALTYAREVRKGFLVLLGPVGVGKSHLAVGVMRHFGRGRLWIKQSTLLRELRATYRDHEAADPIAKCQEAELLVLDEMGVSGGGRDEGPMLHEILDFRYGAKLPTITTSNLTWDELRADLGDRLADRLRECAFKVLILAGPSHRPQKRDTYFSP